MINLIPKPAYVEERLGEFTVTRDSTVYADSRLTYARDRLLEAVEKACGFRLQVVATKQASIRFLVDKHIPQEGYTMEAGTEQLTVTASSIAGAFYAVQSFRQLTLTELLDNPQMLSMHALYIKDEPLYQYRGILFDDARYFHGPETVKSLLDMMAFALASDRQRRLAYRDKKVSQINRDRIP